MIAVSSKCDRCFDALVPACVRSCPFDFIKIYDGPSNEYEVIDIYCGTLQNVQVFSTNESLHIEFVTKSGRAEATKKTYLTYDEKAETEVERRGFNATFDISNSFFNLGQFIVGLR
jgi:Fe-S-cluster-containing dehydrogenase component